MRGLSSACFALFLPLTTSNAQSTADRAKLSIGIALGASSGTTAWSISGQPIIDNNSNIDTMKVGRKLNGSISAALTLVYFPGAHWGFTGEITLIGGRYDASCTMTSASSSQNVEVCATINQAGIRSNNVALDAGVLYRILSQKRFSPYLSARGGLLLGSNSAVHTSGSRGPTIVTLYADPTPHRAVPVAMLSAGFTAGAGPGYQFRWEIRDVFMSVEEVTGVTDGRPNREPEHGLRFRQRWSFMFGFEVVLDRAHGRRY